MWQRKLQKQKMIQPIGNSLPKMKRYSRSGLMIVLSALVLVGCSSTPSLQSLEGWVGTKHSQLGAAPSEPSVPAAQSASLPENFANGTGGDELPQIQAPEGKYVLGSGDLVTVTVWGHPELSGKRVIGPDGEIQFPFVGSFKVAGLDADRRAGSSHRPFERTISTPRLRSSSIATIAIR